METVTTQHTSGGRRRFLQRAGALTLCVTNPSAGLALAGAADVAPAKSRLILLGTAGGPTPKPNRAAPAQVIVVNGASYVIDCGNAVASQFVKAKLKLASLRSIFVTHHH